MENELNGGGPEAAAAAGGGAGDAGGPPELAWRREFDTVPSNGKAVFGGLRVRHVLSGPMHTNTTEIIYNIVSYRQEAVASWRKKEKRSGEPLSGSEPASKGVA